MKRIFMRIGVALLVIVGIVVALVLGRVGLSAVQVARAGEAEVAGSLTGIGNTKSLAILPLYEEAASGVGYESGHGVSYLVRTDEHTILMDLGNNPERTDIAPMVRNMVRAGLAPDAADILFISHNHPDHLGGLQWQPSSFYTEDGQSVLDVEAAYVPVALRFAGVTSHVTEVPQIIAPGVATLGRMPFVQPFPFWLWDPLEYEQALAVNVEGKGVVLISGCGHPTLEKMVARAEALFEEPVVGVVGGLHYEGMTEEEVAPHVAFLAARDPQLVALSPHDSTPQAIKAFREAFRLAYRHVQVGETIRFGSLAVSGTE